MDTYALTEVEPHIKQQPKSPPQLNSSSQAAALVDLVGYSDNILDLSLFVPDSISEQKHSGLSTCMEASVRPDIKNSRSKRKRSTSPGQAAVSKKRKQKPKAAKTLGSKNAKPKKSKSKKSICPMIGDEEEIVYYDPITAQNGEPDLSEALIIEASTKKQQLDAMLENAPGGGGGTVPQNRRDRAAINRATKAFGGTRVYAVNGAWRLRGMETREYLTSMPVS